MNKKINIFLAGVLCSLGVMAQEDTLIVRQNDEVVEMGRTITMAYPLSDQGRSRKDIGHSVEVP